MRHRLATFVNAIGLRLEDRGWLRASHAAYRAAFAIDPTWSVPAFNLGLMCKRARDWPRSRSWNLRACAVATRGDACWWNLGIAATALADWETARYAWRGYGIELDDGSGPPNMELGLTPIRVSPESSAEVVWCDRIDPARAIIRNVPLPDSGRRFGDLVLHDGEPRGRRMLGAREVAVFDEIDVIERSSCSTHEALIAGVGTEAIVALADVFEQAGFCAENWTQSIRVLCAACSEGRPHEHEETHAADAETPATWTVGLAAPKADVERLVSTWRESHADARVERLTCVLE